MRNTWSRRPATFVFTITLAVCQCPATPVPYYSSHVPDRCVDRAVSYWSLYQAFFWHGREWVRFEVIDTRDGRVIWRNGADLKGDAGGSTTLDIPA